MFETSPPKKPWETDAPLNQMVPNPANYEYLHSQVPPATNINYGNWNMSPIAPHYGYGPRGVGTYGAVVPSFGTGLPAFNSIEAGANSIVEQMKSIVTLITGLAQFLDSTIYASWSSINAIGLVVTNLRSLKDFIIRLISRTAVVIRSITSGMIGANHSRRLVLLVAVSSLPYMFKFLLGRMSPEGSISATVTHGYRPLDEGHLDLEPGQIVKIIKIDEEWALGVNSRGIRGYFPLNYVKLPS